MSAANVLKMIKDQDIQFVDFRFTDTKGKEQHVSVPAAMADEDMFDEGKMFDGSSIAGWKGIQESDMILMPDANSAVIDPFLQDTTLLLRCDVIEPTTMQGYDRDPRTIAKRGEAYLKSTGIGDAAYFGPEAEFFIFDSVRWSNDISGAAYEIESKEAAWSSDRDYEEGNIGHRPGVKGVISRFRRSTRCRMCAPPCVLPWQTWGCRLRFITMKWALPVKARLAHGLTHWSPKPISYRSTSTVSITWRMLTV